ncbi:3-phosphoserine/phosphohydroxythreonine transaminase [Thiothrix unzii]|uniref:3-phosphoserine/phosphohydroxythreonine transaminase n=1 Tax=Thiothrix unzii TaxID=111769 RepID=UPI002A35E58E|nr:3-phosphoserine/phosphohydroxythreonine transaminase [Thiothrix unzii]MDX9989445.1 3-phosphoserine/phosphohydroxythreonine transaminase [Thiothrix unzii]
MNHVFNFSAGPAMLPQPILEQAQREMLNWQGTGMSVIEMSHRGTEFMSIAAQAEADLRDIMGIPPNYKVLFLQGGASSQFAMIPMNLLRGKCTADYVETGDWSSKAIHEANKYCNVKVVTSTKASSYTHIPAFTSWNCNPHAAYLHYTPNETIRGVEFPFVPETGDVPLVADMSSSILSCPVNVSQFGLIYAGAQKNIGPAGLVVVIVRDDLLGNSASGTPSLYDYQILADHQSMYNTPPTYAWYLSGLVFQWIKQQGGVTSLAATNARKAQKLYATIDASHGFYQNPVEPPYRSRMNVPFMLADKQHENLFLAEALESGLANLQGHRFLGGMRASIYNAMPEAGVEALVDFMQDFMQRYG